MVEAVVFDCDGVLVDSESLAWEAWRRVLGTYDVEVTEDDMQGLTGRSQSDVYAAFAARGDLPPQPRLDEQISSVLFELFDRGLRVFPDVPRTLEALTENGIRLAVASSSARDRLDRTLALVELTGWFETSVAGDEVENAKPQPDLFLEVARRLGVSPGACVAIEDTPAGVASARGAGMCTIGVLRGDYTGLELGASRVIESLDASSILGECASRVAN